MEEIERVLRFARKLYGAEVDVQYVMDWKGYRVYATWWPKGEIPCTGLPYKILFNPENNEIRLTNYDETWELF